MISVQGVSKKFNCGSSWENLFNPLQIQAIDNLTFEHPSGKILLVTGGTGGGKSVLLDLLAGIYRPDAGEITIFSRAPGLDPELRSRIALVRPDRDQLDLRISARRNLQLLAAWYRIEKAEATARVEEMLDYVELEPAARKVPLGELSPGTINLVNLAGGLISSPKLLLLDEPDMLIDNQAREKLRNLLAGLVRQEKTIVLASTSERLVKSLDYRRLVMVDGRGDIDD